tara:strand:+ start:3963 stop:5792 length:1830 start_codon:yes stop_codon:yes gene_type:complete
MAEFKFLSTARTKALEIRQDVTQYISRVYGRASELFTTASPFSQIIAVVSEITEMIFFYIEDSTVEQNILTAQQPESIYGLARLTGHDPTRGFSARGEIEIRWAPGKSNDVTGSALYMPTNLQIKSDMNGFIYLLRSASDIISLSTTEVNYIKIPIIEGIIENQTVTGTGLEFQTFNIQTGTTTAHDEVKVSVNGKPWQVFASLYDMKANTDGVVVKTGILGGIDLFFGNGNFGAIPANGSIIGVEYIKSNGAGGNLGESKDVTFKFIDSGYDGISNEYDLNELLEINVTSSPKMGAAPESIEFTKLIAPLQSKSFVLATPDNYEHFLARYDMFSYIDAYNTTDDQYLDDDNIIYLFLLPDVAKKTTGVLDYFSVPTEEFLFSQSELGAIRETIERSGQQMVTTEIDFVQPTKKMYSMNITVRHFEGFDEIQLMNDIRIKVSEYLIKVTRRDRLPKSDIVALIEGIDGIDSVNVQFISKSQEDALRDGFYTTTQTTIVPQTPVLEDVGNGKNRILFFKKTIVSNTVTFTPAEGIPAAVKTEVTGLDEFGDIVLGKQEIAIFRGGWKDRSGGIVVDEPKIGLMASLSVAFTTPIPRTVYTRIQASNRKAL